MYFFEWLFLVINNDKEVQSLARQIGIDYETEKEKYLWFLAQVHFFITSLITNQLKGSES